MAPHSSTLAMGGGAWWAAVHGVAKSRTWLRDFTFTFHFHALEKEMATHSSVLAWRISSFIVSHLLGKVWWSLISNGSWVMDLGSSEKTWTTKTVVPIKGILEEVKGKITALWLMSCHEPWTILKLWVSISMRTLTIPEHPTGEYHHLKNQNHVWQYSEQ